MTGPPYACPISLDEMTDYVLGELSETRTRGVEDHVFECARCASSFEALDAMRRGIVATVRCAEVGCAVGEGVLARAVADGLSLRQYRIEPGHSVTCKAGPEDFVVVRLGTAGSALENARLHVEFEDLENAEAATLPERELVVDHQAGEVVLLFPGSKVRQFPRSRWTMMLTGLGAQGAVEMGPFIMEHWP